MFYGVSHSRLESVKHSRHKSGQLGINLGRIRSFPYIVDFLNIWEFTFVGSPCESGLVTSKYVM